VSGTWFNGTFYPLTDTNSSHVNTTNGTKRLALLAPDVKSVVLSGLNGSALEPSQANWEAIEATLWVPPTTPSLFDAERRDLISPPPSLGTSFLF
jgi:hypothetical protein